MLSVSINKGGSFDLLQNGAPVLKDCFPAIDGRPLRVQSIFLKESEIIYTAEAGKVRLSFKEVNENLISLTPSLMDYSEKIHFFSPLWEGVVCDFKGWFRQSGSTGDSCGYFDTCKDDLSYSRGLTAIETPVGCMSIYTADHRKYTTRFNLHESKGAVLASGEYSVENCNNENQKLPTMYLYFSKSLEDGLNFAADEIGKEMKARSCMEPAYHWCSWYYCYHNFDRKQLSQYLEGFNRVGLKPRYIQIDAGNCTAMGDWLTPTNEWSEGYEEAFSAVKEAGFKPGIWIGAYMVGNRSKVYREHPDWVLHNLDGTPLVCMVTDNEPKLWNYQDEEYYCMDTSHPKAMDYLVGVFRTMRGFGARLFKTDFMMWGYRDSTTVKRHTPGKTSVEYMRDFFEAVREEIGEDSYWLGCIAPFFPFIGYADAMRIGGDVGSQWSGGFNVQNMISTVIGNNHINHSFFQNDPDAMLLRDFHIRLTETEIISLSRLMAMSGGCTYTSDPLHLISPERRQLFDFYKPDKRRKASQPYIDNDLIKGHVLVQSEGSKALVLVFNSLDNDIFEEYTLEELGFKGEVFAYDFDEGGKVQGKISSLILKTPAHGSRLILLSQNDREAINKGRLWSNLSS